MSKGIASRIAGFQHHRGSSEWLGKHKEGDHRVLLVPEPDNPHDKNAIRIVTSAGLMLGYVPAVDAPGVLAKLKDRDTLVRAFKTRRQFNAVDIHYITEDPLA